MLVSIKVNTEKFEEIKSFYKDNITKNNVGEYTDFIAKINGIVITGFSSKKDKRTITFNGSNALEEAKIWDAQAKEVVLEKKTATHFIDFDDQIGSDEVGVGDYLLPMIVVAAFVSKNQMNKIKEYGIDDSKKMNDSKIIEIGPKIVKEFKFSKLTLSNDKYNQMLDKGENINSLKAKMHNRALANLHKQFVDVDHIYVDQFVSENKYYSYFTKEDEPIVRGISFKTKGESYFPCVALASVIARYSFLLEKQLLENKLGLEVPFGASKKADLAAKKIKEKIGETDFIKLVKKNFANYKEDL